MRQRPGPDRLLILTVCLLTACTTWRAQTAPPGETLATPREQVRLTMTDGNAHVLHITRLQGDRVVGMRSRSTSLNADTLSFPVADVRKVEIHQFSTGRTVALAAGVAGAIVIFGILLNEAIQEDIDLSGAFPCGLFCQGS